MSGASKQLPVVASDAAVSQVVEQSLQSLWQVVNHLAQIKPLPPERFRVTVFGSARIKPGQALYEDVKRLTSELALGGCDIVTGGGPGLMQAANEGAQANADAHESTSIGVGIALPFEDGANPFVEQVYTHETFYTRLHQFVRLSHAFVVVGGGIGTTLETFLIWQLLQVRHITDVPLIFVGKQWHALRDWATEHMLSHDPPLADAEDLDLPICVASIDEALEHLRPRIAQYRSAHNET